MIKKTCHNVANNVKFFATVVLTLFTYPVRADTPMQRDFQCMTAMTIAYTLANNPNKTLDLAGSMYFAGKIYGRDPHADLVAIGQGLPGITAQSAKKIMPACSKEIAERGAEITAAGEHIRSVGK